MKKRSWFALGVAMLLLFSLVGCGEESADSADVPTTTITTTQEQEEIVLDASDARFTAIQEFLNQWENNAFVGASHLFDAPQKASLYRIFGGVDLLAHWDATERAAALAACGWDGFHVPVGSVPTELWATEVEQVPVGSVLPPVVV